MNDRILVVATHPDDETLGAGGSILKFKAKKAEVFWLIVTHVHTKHGYSEERVQSRNDEIARVASMYSFDDTFNLGFPTTRLDEIPRGDIIRSIAGIFGKVQPSHVILPFYGDIHTDHRVAFECAYSCTKVFRAPYINNIWMMETLSETDFGLPGQHQAFTPNLFIDTSSYQELKEEIFRVFESESAPHPFPRSIENLHALALNRGATAGCNFAEAFMNVKMIIR